MCLLSECEVIDFIQKNSNRQVSNITPSIHTGNFTSTANAAPTTKVLLPPMAGVLYVGTLQITDTFYQSGVAGAADLLVMLQSDQFLPKLREEHSLPLMNANTEFLALFKPGKEQIQIENVFAERLDVRYMNNGIADVLLFYWKFEGYTIKLT